MHNLEHLLLILSLRIKDETGNADLANVSTATVSDGEIRDRSCFLCQEN